MPSQDVGGGWLSFFASIFGVGILTAVISDVASHFGCFTGMRDQVTAITVVALGTSVPGGKITKKNSLREYIWHFNHLFEFYSKQFCTPYVFSGLRNSIQFTTFYLQ